MTFFELPCRAVPLLLAVLLLAGCGRTGLFPYASTARDAEREPDLSGDLDGGLDLVPATCGDGMTDEGEECDDGNDVDDDACSNACRLVPDDPCSPCEVNDDCARPQDGCLVLLDGSFCGLDCGDGSPCPDGYLCQDALTADGSVLAQCVPELEVCAGCFDRDEDGYGVGAECLGTDCNDSDPSIHPFADEFCDGVDTDCDGVLDEDDALDAELWYRDADADGYGDPDVTRRACSQPAGWVADNTDCNDQVTAINPGAREICDDIDNNCNLENDEGCPPDLIVDAEQIELSGSFLFDRVEILNGGVVRVTAFDGVPGSPDSGTTGLGCLEIEARIVRVRANSGINASESGGGGLGIGRNAGFGPGLQNTGPSGGGYGGRGGNSDGFTGGTAFGTPSGPDLDMGSNGGSFSVLTSVAPACDPIVGMISEGGVGGGCVSLTAATSITVDGFIRARGGLGDSAVDSTQPRIVDGGAGASGGGILLRANRIDVAGVLDVRGGAGGNGAEYSGAPNNETCIGNGGGGGGGGRIKLFSTRGTSVSGALNVGGGAAGRGPQSDAFAGSPGTTVIE